MKPPRYVLRVSVKLLGKEPIKGLELEPCMVVGQLTVTIRQRWSFLILLARDFASEIEAESFLPHIKRGLYSIAMEHNIAFKPYFERRSITRAADPEQAARNIAKSFGQVIKEPIDPVHGLTEEEGYSIFRSDENLRYLAMGEVTGYVSTGWDAVSKTLADGIQIMRPFPDEFLSGTTMAMDLYLTCFYETSIRARLLTLITCLEVLAPVTERHATVLAALSTFKRQIDGQLAKATDEEQRNALEALISELDFKKETSIRRRVRQLVLSEAPLAKDARTELARKVVSAYDFRGTVVHAGAVDSRALDEAHEIALKTVKLLIRARLGLACQPPDATQTPA